VIWNEVKALVVDLRGSKTFWLCVAGLSAVAAGWANGAATSREAIVAAFVCVLSIFQRHAVEKGAIALLVAASVGCAPPTGRYEVSFGYGDGDQTYEGTIAYESEGEDERGDRVLHRVSDLPYHLDAPPVELAAPSTRRRVPRRIRIKRLAPQDIAAVASGGG